MSGEIKGFSREFIIYGVSSLINRGIQVIVLPLIFIFLTKEQFGILDFFLTTKNLLYAIFGWGIITAIIRFGATFSDHEFSEVFSNSVIALMLVIFSFGIIFFSTVSNINDLFFEKNYFDEFSITFIIACVLAFQTIPLGVLRTKRQPWKYFFVSFSFFLFFIIATLVLLLFDYGYWGFLYGHLVGAILSVLIGYLLTAKYFSFKLNFRLLGKLLKFGFSILTTSIAFTILTSSSRYFLKLDNSIDTLGILGMSTRLSLVVGALLVLPFNLAWLPFINSIYKTDKFQLLTQRVFEWFNVVAVILVLGVSLFAYDLFYLTKNIEYIESYKYIPFFSTSYLLLGNYYIFSSGIYLSKKSKRYIIISIITVLVNLLLYYIFLGRITLFYASLVTLLSYLMLVVLAYLYGNRIINISVFSLSIKKLIFFLLVLIIAIALSINFIHDYYNQLMIRLLLYGLFTLFTILSILKTNEKKEIKRIINRFLLKNP